MPTRWPLFCARKISMAASHCASAAMKLVCAVCRLASKRPLPMGWPLPRPALTITRSIEPNSSLKARNTSKTWAWSFTSSARTATRTPECLLSSSALSASRRSVRRAHRARWRPLAANSRAMPSPRPELAPVIRMVCRVGMARVLEVLLEVQEGFQRRHGARRVFLLRHMAQALEHHQLAASDVLLEVLSVVGRDQTVLTAPQDQRGLTQLL